MILEALISQFQQRFHHEKRAQVCLWFDEKGEFTRLLPRLRDHIAKSDSPPFGLLEYDPEVFHGQIWIKHQIHKELFSLPPSERKKKRFVIYLPLSQERLNGPDEDGNHHLELFVEYTVAGLMWQVGGKRPTLFSFMRHAGVNLPENPSDQRKLWEGGRDSLLAKYVAKYFDRPREFWEAMITPEVAQSRLIGDVDQTILDMATAPGTIWSELQESGLDKEFLDSVRERYGFDYPVVDPVEWVQDFVAAMALTETFIGYGEPADFPFAERLPALAVREHHVHLLRRWLRDAESRPAWDRWIAEVESRVDLTDWATNRDGLSFGFPHLVLQRWKRTLDAFEQTTPKISQTSEFFKKWDQQLRKEAEFARASHTRVGSWDLLNSLGEFLTLADEAVGLIKEQQTVADLASLYVDQAPKVDSRHLKIRHQALEHELPTVGRVADRLYAEYINLLNDRFFRLFTGQGTSDIPGVPPVTQGLEKVLWHVKEKRAVIIVDSLRYDCAHEIKERLPGQDIRIEPLRANLPAITPIGMTALMPLSGTELSFEYHSNNLHPKVNGKDMAQRENRLEFLIEFGAACREIDEVEAAVFPPKGLGGLLVVFGHEEVDRLGHGRAETLIRHLYVEIERLAKLVKKLHRWGYPTVHIVTDHGFILLDEDRLPPEVPCDKAWCHVLKERFALVPAEADVPIKSLPFDWDEGLRVALPPGMAFFKAEKSFSHGGGTLQELIIPHFVSRTHLAKPKIVGIEVVLPSYRLMQSMVKVTLRAVVQQGKKSQQMDFFTDAGRTLCLDVLRIEKSGQQRSVLATGRPKQVRVDPTEDKEVIVNLFFHTALSLQAGELLDLDIRDVDTGEQFPPGGIKLTVGRNL